MLNSDVNLSELIVDTFCKYIEKEQTHDNGIFPEQIFTAFSIQDGMYCEENISIRATLEYDTYGINVHAKTGNYIVRFPVVYLDKPEDQSSVSIYENLNAKFRDFFNGLVYMDDTRTTLQEWFVEALNQVTPYHSYIFKDYEVAKTQNLTYFLICKNKFMLQIPNSNYVINSIIDIMADLRYWTLIPADNM